MTGRLRQDIEVEAHQRSFNGSNFFWRALNGSWITTIPRPENWKAIHFFDVCDETVLHSVHSSRKEPISDFVIQIHTQIRTLPLQKLLSFVVVHFLAAEMPAHFIRLDTHPTGLDGAALDDITQFAHVARPRVAREFGQRVFSKG